MIKIPVDAHLLTLTVTTQDIVEEEIRVGREMQKRRKRKDVVKCFPTKQTAAKLALAIGEVNKIFAPADVEFTLRSATPKQAASPTGTDGIDEAGFLALAKEYKANNGISLIYVPRFTGKEGGSAVEAMGVCAVGDVSHANALPHELGHLVGLDHQGDIRDLMNPGLSVPGAALTAKEIAEVQASRLYRQFSAPAKTP